MSSPTGPADPPPPPRRPARLRRLVVGGAFGTGALLLLAAVALYGLLATQPGASFVLERVARLAGARIEGVEGSLAGPLAVASFELDRPLVRVRARGVRLDWSPARLAGREVRIDSLHAASLEIATVRSSEPGRPPDSLALPFRLYVAQAGLDRLSVGTIGEEGGVELRELSVKLAADAAAWIVGEAQALTPLGRAKLGGTVGAIAPFALEAKGELLGERRGAPYAIAVEANGHLSALSLALRGKEGGLAGEASARVEPFAKVPLARLEATLDGVDLAAFVNAPHTKLAVRAKLEPRGDALLAGPVRIVNAEAGPLDRDRLPVATLEGVVSVRADRLEASALKGTFAPGGSAEGHAAWAGGKLEARLAVKDGDLLSWHSTLRATRLAGQIRAVAGADAQAFVVDLADPRFSIAGDVTIAGGRVTVGKARLARGTALAQASGSVAFRGERDFEVQGLVQGFDPALYARVPAGELNGRFAAKGSFARGWRGELDLEIAKSRFAGLEAQGRAQLAGDGTRLARADVDLAVGATRLRLKGALGAAGDALEADLHSPDLGPLGRAFGLALGGKVDLEARLAGAFAAPSGRATLLAENLLLPGPVRIARVSGTTQVGAGEAGIATGSFAVGEITTGAARDKLVREGTVTLKGTRASHEVRVYAALSDDSTYNAFFDGGLLAGAAQPAWRGTLGSLEITGLTATALAAPASLYLSPERIELGEARFGGPTGFARLATTRWTPAGFELRGTSQGIVLRTILRAVGLQQQAGSNLVLSGEWDVRVGETVDGFVQVKRDRGDLRVGEPRQALGLEALVLRAEAVRSRVKATVEVRGEHVGRWQGEAQASLQRGGEGWEIAPVAPLEGRFSIDVPDLAFTSAWIGPEARAGGRLAGEGTLGGTMRDPTWSGRVAATHLAIREPTLGAEVGEGNIVVTLMDRDARIERFELTAPWTPGTEAAQALAGVKRPAAGTLVATGAIDLGKRQGAIQVKSAGYPLTRLATRFLAVSGEGRVEFDGHNTAVLGDFVADAGWFGIPASAPPSLSDDVIVERGEPAPVAERGHERMRLDLRFGLGDHLHFRGRGLATRLAGNLRVSGDVGAALRTTGSIRAVGGTYDAYGRTLSIERGAINFQGPIDNPGLNVLALRKGLPVEAGVEVLGTVNRPKVRLVSSPDVPDPEKLAWLVLGRGQGEVSAGDAAMLVGAANTLLGNDVLTASKIITGLGFDEIRLGRDAGGTLGAMPQSTVAGKTGSNSAAEVVTVGKRLTDDIYVSYRQGLADAEGSVRVAWQLTRSLEIILRAGYLPGVDAVYRFSFD